jgi:UDP-N-acetylmuramoyl-L-alanyl-D-glutamate--2,6-diaminopimelate ligase
MNAHCDFKFSKIRQTFKGTKFQLDVKEKSYLVQVPLIGKFNVYNVVSAITACAAAGMKVRDAVKSLAEAPQVPGRMENVGNVNGMSVFVDYAHTPDALKNACITMRELEPRNLITVFGCGGDRDNAKRPLMGEAAAANSEYCIVTSDNPRSEDPEAIIKMVEAGMAGKRYHVIVDRAEAIEAAVNFARPGDAVLIAGKGHETYQEFATETITFDDRAVARRVLNDFRVGDLKERMAKVKEQESNNFHRGDRNEGDRS